MYAHRSSERQRHLFNAQHTSVMNNAALGEECGHGIARRRSTTFVLSIALLCYLTLMSSTSRIPAAHAFCRSLASTTTTRQHRTSFTFTSKTTSKSTSTSKLTTKSSTALGLLRPEWMRRAGRIEEKRQEREKWNESLRSRQEELGLAIPEQSKDASPNSRTSQSQPQPQRYRVVSASCKDNSHGSTQWNGTSAPCIPKRSGDKEHENDDDNDDDDDDLLKIYLVVPENEVEARDESNVLDCLEHGEVVTSIQQRTVSSEEPVRPAVVAASIIYNIDPATTMLSQRDVLWIEHDKGGWSPSVVDGVTRLVPIEDNEEVDL